VDRLQDEKPQNLCQYAGQVVLVVLGFPSNDFGRQEPGANAAIADFCENTFGVKFPMFVKTVVTGAEADPLYRELAQRTGQRPQWNFHKYLVARDGQAVRSYASMVDPLSPQVVKEIERLLALPR
jgi:glutathione peroxidase